MSNGQKHSYSPKNYTLKKEKFQKNFAAGDGAVSRDQEAV